MPQNKDRKFQKLLKEKTTEIEAALSEYIPKEDEFPKSLTSAIRESLLNGGKRVRPVFVILCAEALGRSPAGLMDLACSTEMIQTSSLILDDLPCMDDATLRRGKPAIHTTYGEATAILAAVAILMQGVELISRAVSKSNAGGGVSAELTSIASRSVGIEGMIGGQHVDLASVGKAVDFKTLEYIHSHKTGSLFIACAEMASLFCGANNLERKALVSFAKNIGLAFQIIDDILDVTTDAGTLGKDVKMDKDKTTFVSLTNIEEARKVATELVDTANNSLIIFKQRAENLKNLGQFILTRDR